MMRYYPTFTLDQIEQMTLEEYGQRIKAHTLNVIDRQRILNQLPFIDRAAKAVNEDGSYLFAQPDQIVDLDKAEREVTGEARKEVNYYAELSQRAKDAELLARKQLNM
jgi:hypothetical protein